MSQIKNRELKKRIIDISYEHHLSHLSSSLTSLDIINDIFSNKKEDEKFVLSSGHSGLALYVALENYWKARGRNIDAEYLLEHCGIHPDRKNAYDYIDCSTGSLGQGLPIACGMALADKSRNVYCLISDGECAEGSIWEAIRLAYENHLTNLKIYVNINGWGAYKKIDVANLIEDLTIWKKRGVNIEICETNIKLFEDVVDGLKGQSAHYYQLTEDDHIALTGILE